MLHPRPRYLPSTPTRAMLDMAVRRMLIADLWTGYLIPEDNRPGTADCDVNVMVMVPTRGDIAEMLLKYGEVP